MWLVTLWCGHIIIFYTETLQVHPSLEQLPKRMPLDPQGAHISWQRNWLSRKFCILEVHVLFKKGIYVQKRIVLAAHDISAEVAQSATVSGIVSLQYWHPFAAWCTLATTKAKTFNKQYCSWSVQSWSFRTHCRGSLFYGNICRSLTIGTQRKP